MTTTVAGGTIHRKTSIYATSAPVTLSGDTTSMSFRESLSWNLSAMTTSTVELRPLMANSHGAMTAIVGSVRAIPQPRYARTNFLPVSQTAAARQTLIRSQTEAMQNTRSRLPFCHVRTSEVSFHLRDHLARTSSWVLTLETVLHLRVVRTAVRCTRH